MRVPACAGVRACERNGHVRATLSCQSRRADRRAGRAALAVTIERPGCIVVGVDVEPARKGERGAGLGFWHIIRAERIHHHDKGCGRADDDSQPGADPQLFPILRREHARFLPLLAFEQALGRVVARLRHGAAGLALSFNEPELRSRRCLPCAHCRGRQACRLGVWSGWSGWPWAKSSRMQGQNLEPSVLILVEFLLYYW
jgi:hypothetical protein